MLRAFFAILAAGAVAVKGQNTTTNITTVNDSQYWHERYHGLLSMAAYGDYATECPNTFTEATLLASFPDSTAEPWTVLSEWGPTASGLEGFNVYVPEMDKVVMVIKGIYGWEEFNMTAAPMTVFGIDETRCSPINCTAHQGALTAYLEAQNATDDWAIVKEYVNATGAQWSVTGHGFGGMVAQIAAIDLGWRGLCHWSHNHGSARVFSPAAAALYDSLFEGQAGQRAVANNDVEPTIIPESSDYTFTLQGFHIYGTNTTYGMNYDICATSATDPNCLGGNSTTDHDFYYTPIGFCGGSNVSYATAYQSSFEEAESSSFYLTATSTFVIETPTSTATPTTGASTTATELPSSTTATSATGAASPSGDTVGTASQTGAAYPTRVTRTVLYLLAIGGAFFIFI